MALIKKLLFILILSQFSLSLMAQELIAKININHQQIQGTDASVFDNLQKTMEQFIN